MRILVVEDDPKVARSLSQGLEEEGYRTEVLDRGDAAAAALEESSYDFVVLDLNLPGEDGMDVLRAARARGDETPVLVLTARGAVEDRVEGLDAGADDYLVKPFAFAELLARMRVLLRRGRKEETLVLHAGDLELDLVTRSLTRGDDKIELTPRELAIVELLMRHPGKAVSREIMAREIWDQERSSAIDNLMEVLLGRLRKKIERKDEPRCLRTVRGVGYMLVDADAPS